MTGPRASSPKLGYIGVDLQIFGRNLDHRTLEKWLTDALGMAVEGYNKNPENQEADSQIDTWEFSEFEHTGVDDNPPASGPWESGLGEHG